ncbi:MAG: hypothetical protein IT285_03295 [Bdellovibrionales bacterium]|nr:hypothetical protein [Bdellovibrionales bacterium]
MQLFHTISFPRIAALLLAASSWSSSVIAATRVIQFVGVGASEYTSGEINNENLSASCIVIVSNTGETTQVVDDFDFIRYDSGNSTTSWVAPDQQALRSSGAPSDTACIGQNLPSGGFCAFRLTNDSIPIGGRYLVCSGRITVRDAQADQPGSITASGVTSAVQEAMVMGGVLSGAYYAGGVHLWSLSNVALATDGNGAPDPNAQLGLVHNMNMYCRDSCVKYVGGGAPTAAHEEMCTIQCGHMWPASEPDNSFSTSIQYHVNWVDNAWNAWSGQRFNTVEFNWLHDWLSASESCGDQSLTGTWSGGGTGSASANSCTNAGTRPSAATGRAAMPQAVLRNANDHFAGGSVYELQIGPLASICSGLRSYFLQGGAEFTHADGIDTHAFVAPNGNYGPERLLCHHRHAKDDLYLRVGSSSSFTINGGLAF